MNALNDRLNSLPQEERLVAGPNTISADNYQGLTFIAAAASPSIQDWVKSHRITRVFAFKDLNRKAQHEFIVFEFKVPGHGKFLVRLDRTCGKEHSGNDTDTSSSLSALVKGSYLANNCFMRIPSIEFLQPLTPMEIYEPTHDISLLEIATLANTQHTSYPAYTLLHQSCFWQTQSFLRVIKLRGGENKQSAQGNPSPNKAGTYCSITITTVLDSQAQSLSNDVDAQMIIALNTITEVKKQKDLRAREGFEREVAEEREAAAKEREAAAKEREDLEKRVWELERENSSLKVTVA